MVCKRSFMKNIKKKPKNKNYIFFISGFFDFFLKLFIGGNKRPVFYDVEKDYPELLAIKANKDIIQDELQAILKRNIIIPKFHQLDPAQYNVSHEIDKNKQWKIFLLYSFGEKPQQNRALCPKTCAILDKQSSVGQAFFQSLREEKVFLLIVVLIVACNSDQRSDLYLEGGGMCHV